MKLSTGLRNSLLSTLSMKELLDDTVIRIYTGTVPSTVDASLPNDAVMLVEIRTGEGGTLTLDPAVQGGVVTKNAAEVWAGTAVNTGTATFFRMVKAADTGATSTTAVRVQGTAGIGAKDMQLASADIITGQEIQVSFFNLTLPEGE